MTAATERPAPPPYEVQFPLCSVCGDETTHDGYSILCEECRIRWSENGDEGRWVDHDQPQCKATYRPLPKHPVFRHVVYRCYLTDGHEGKHNCPDAAAGW